VKLIIDKTTRSRRHKLRAVAGNSDWILRVYVAGQSSKAIAVVSNLKSICEEQLKCKYHIEVVDILKNPRLARDNDILAVPTVVRVFPLPVRTIIGDLSNTDRALLGLDLIDPSALQYKEMSG
jgi:circadian clock protein KaiB